MRIARVEPAFSQPERRLLRLLARLYAYQEQMEGRDKGNWDMCVLPLSDNELDELRDLLDELVSSQEFLAKSYFVENIYEKNMDVQLERRLRELYFSERSARGRRNRTMSGRHWGDFKARLGIAPPFPAFRTVRRMSFDHFLRMEERLFQLRGLGKGTVSALLEYVRVRRERVEAWRNSHTAEVFPKLRQMVIDPVLDFLRRARSTPEREISVKKIAALMVVICNMGILFTTLDWGVAGTISTLAGALPLIVGN